MSLERDIVIKHIFFDFDGVLAESLHIKTEAFYKMYRKHGEELALRVKKHHLENGGMSRYEKFKVYNGQWLGEDIDEERIQELASEFSSLVINGVINSEEVQGTSRFLNSPESERYQKYIITGTPTVEIKIILEGRKMTHFFDGIYGSPEKKEYWVEKIIREKEIDAKSCIFIGDALADYAAAKANNVQFILRETPEGENLFKDFDGFRIKDLTTLEGTIQTIETSEL